MDPASPNCIIEYGPTPQTVDPICLIDHTPGIIVYESSIENGPRFHIILVSIFYMCYRIQTPNRKRTPGCVVDIFLM